MDIPKIIAFMSDFGLDDPYVGIVKAVLLSQNPHLKIIDITHSIPPFDIKSGAFVLGGVYRDFPEGTIFLAVVDPEVGGKRAGIVLLADNYLFVAPDNGILSLVIENSRDFKCFRLKGKKYFRTSISSTFHARDIFAPVAAHLSLDVDPSELGHPHPRPKHIEIPAPEIINNMEIQGEIVHIDGFGNLITNIKETHLLSLTGRPKHVVVKGRVIPLLRTYSDAPEKSPLALIGSSGLLEISINQGNASKSLCISNGEKVFLRAKLSQS